LRKLTLLALPREPRTPGLDEVAIELFVQRQGH